MRGEFKLFHFDRHISSEDVVKEIEKEGYMPANLTELLSYSKDGWNNEDWIIALGSVAKVSGDRGVPYLDRDGAGRSLYLSLDWWDRGWNGRCRFLAVRNSNSDTKTLEKALSPSDTMTLKNLEARVARIERLFNPEIL